MKQDQKVIAVLTTSSATFLGFQGQSTSVDLHLTNSALVIFDTFDNSGGIDVESIIVPTCPIAALDADCFADIVIPKSSICKVYEPDIAIVAEYLKMAGKLEKDLNDFQDELQNTLPKH